LSVFFLSLSLLLMWFGTRRKADATKPITV
jgi:hypothetical protein